MGALRRKACDISRAPRGQEQEFKSAAMVIDRRKKLANFQAMLRGAA